MAPQGRLCALTIADYMNVRNSSLTRKGKKKKKSFTEFQTYKFKRQIRVYLIWMDLWLLGL